LDAEEEETFSLAAPVLRCPWLAGWLAAPPWLGGCPSQRPEEEERLDGQKRKARMWEGEKGSGFLYL
jgi:hypothetical protein